MIWVFEKYKVRTLWRFTWGWSRYMCVYYAHINKLAVMQKKDNSAIEKWYELKPEFFKEKPNDFKNKSLTRQQIYYASLY